MSFANHIGHIISHTAVPMALVHTTQNFNSRFSYLPSTSSIHAGTLGFINGVLLSIVSKTFEDNEDQSAKKLFSSATLLLTSGYYVVTHEVLNEQSNPSDKYVLVLIVFVSSAILDYLQRSKIENPTSLTSFKISPALQKEKTDIETKANAEHKIVKDWKDKVLKAESHALINFDIFDKFYTRLLELTESTDQPLSEPLTSTAAHYRFLYEKANEESAEGKKMLFRAQAKYKKTLRKLKIIESRCQLELHLHKHVQENPKTGKEGHLSFGSNTPQKLKTKISRLQLRNLKQRSDSESSDEKEDRNNKFLTV
jgi:hypothetical protein